VRYYNVFNLAQVDGATLPADTAPELPECERIAHAEAFIAALPGLDLRRGGDMAFYMPSQDRVQVPPFADFKNPEVETGNSSFRFKQRKKQPKAG